MLANKNTKNLWIHICKVIIYGFHLCDVILTSDELSFDTIHNAEFASKLKFKLCASIFLGILTGYHCG